MIKIEKTEVFGWEASIRGLRNPMNSWDKGDSWFGCRKGDYGHREAYYCGKTCTADCEQVIGTNDLKLMKSLAKAGSDHGKFLRMITVTLDITAPLYWWKEFDTYKVGTVANSCSTMHKIHDKKFTIEDFSCEHLNGYNYGRLLETICLLNDDREYFIATNDKDYWWQMIQMLPSSYNQKRTVQLNYQVLKSVYHARKNHKLDEWREFCEWAETLPYFNEICIDC